MGVQGLWELLAPVGRRVSVESLGSKKLAIDASIWIVQLMKAMRDDKGDMIRNAHLLGFFRRICKLLYLRTKPIFVFDGGTPALKRRTVIARRRQRERAQSQFRKTAEKLLLNHLRTRKLEEIAQNIGLAQLDEKQNLSKMKRKRPEEKDSDRKDDPRRSPPSLSLRDMTGDTIVAQPRADENVVTESTSSMFSVSTEGQAQLKPSESTALNPSDESDDENNEEYFILPDTQRQMDPAVLASLPPSMQLNLLVQMREQQVAENREKFQKVAKSPASFSQLQIQAYLKTVAFRRDIDGVQKAASGSGIGGIPSARIASEVDREYIFSSSFQPRKDVNGHEKKAKIGVAAESGSNGGHTQRHINVTINDQSTMVPESMDLAKSRSGTEVDGRGGSEESDVEWEDGVPAINNQVVLEDEGEAIATHGGDSEVEWEDGNGDIGSGQVGACMDSEEIAGTTLMEIEAAELEEAIRRSLEDLGGSRPLVGSSQLVIRDQMVDAKRTLSPECAVTTDYLSNPNSEDAFLVLERERKGKAIIDDCEENSRSLRRNNLAGQDGADNGLQTSFHSLITTDHQEPVRPEQGKVALHGVEKISSVSEQLPHACSNDQIVSMLEAETVRKRQPDVHEEQVKSLQSLDESKVQVMESQSTSVSGEILESVEPVHSHEDSEVQVHDMYARVNNICDNEVQNLDILNDKGEKTGDEDLRSKHAKAQCEVLNSSLGYEQRSDIALSKIEHHDSEKDSFQDALLREAEELDLDKEREAFSKNEMDILAERDELDRQQAELQAELEAEKATIQAGLQAERDFLLQEEMELQAIQRKNARDAESVTGEMFSECQELLQMFGLPYIIAPMEAEAQCAVMDSIGLVDGVITDDCDVFLFGGQNVYKNIFDDRKYVETYYMKDIKTELGLDQEKLIHMALLLGSDYTEGISGIGIVNAIEVVNAFQGETGLRKFKAWLDAPDFSLLGKVHQKGQSKQTRKTKRQAGMDIKTQDKAEDPSAEGRTETEDLAADKSDFGDYNFQQQVFLEKHRAVSKNWNVPETFPSEAVIDAYRLPQVDKSTEAFSWGRPDLEALRKLCFDRFGWNKSKADELLLPVLKEYDRHETQLRLEAFYTFNQRFAKIRSRRIQKAVTRITGHRSSELMEFPPNADASPKRKKQRKKNPKNAVNEEDAGKLEQPFEAFVDDSHILEERNVGLTDKKDKDTTKVKARAANSGKQGRGRGREKADSRGRLRQKAASRGRGKSYSKVPRESLMNSSGEVSSRDESPSDKTADLAMGKQTLGIDETHLRRSTRLSQRTVYRFSDSEKDEGDSYSHEVEGQRLATSNACSEDVGNAASPSSIKLEDFGSFPVSSINKRAELETPRDIGREDPLSDHDSGVPNSSGLLREQEGMDYLVMGGGFCITDEKDQESLERPSSVTEDENMCSNNYSTPISEDVTGFPTSDTAGYSSLKTWSTSMSGPSEEARFGLRAVPFLRRKKRQSN